MKNSNEKLLIGLIVGIFLGFLVYWSSQIVSRSAETIFIFLISISIFLSIVFLLLVWYRKKILKKYFGEDYEFSTIIKDTQETIHLITTNISDSIPLNSVAKSKIKYFSPRLINYIIWSNFRNWALKIFVSFILGLGGIVTTILILNQNKLFEIQNERIEQQSQLYEAERRSAQISILGDVLTDISKELNSIYNLKDTLSQPLVGRITSLTYAMKPYRYYKKNSLIDKELSPERAQLFLSLLESGMNIKQFRKVVINNSIFKYSDFQDRNLENRDFSNMDLSNSNFIDGNLRKSILFNSNLSHCTLKNTCLVSANLQGAQIENTDFTEASLFFADMRDTFINGANFSNTILDGVKVSRKNWIEYAVYEANVIGGKELLKTYTIDSIYNKKEEDYTYILKRQ